MKKQVVYFLAESVERNVQLSWEHREAQWLQFDEALAHLKYENAQRTLQKAHAFLKTHA